MEATAWKSRVRSGELLSCELVECGSNSEGDGGLSSKPQRDPLAYKSTEEYTEVPLVIVKTEYDGDNTVDKQDSNIELEQPQQNPSIDTYFHIKQENCVNEEEAETNSTTIKLEIETDPTVLQSRTEPCLPLQPVDGPSHSPAPHLVDTYDEEVHPAQPYPVYLQRALRKGVRRDRFRGNSRGTNLHNSGLTSDLAPLLDIDKGSLKKSENIKAQNKFKCEHCSYSTKRKAYLTNHMRKHTGKNRTYKCDQCEYVAPRSSALQSHTRTHTGERAFECERCAYKAARRDRLEIHMRVHTGEKPYKCDRCGYSTSQEANLQRHARIHSGAKPYKCAVCEYAASQLDTLKNHMHTHATDKPYKCELCEYRTSRRSALQEHVNTHTGTKPYKCKQCEYRASSVGTLRRHTLTHTGEKPFKCQQCRYSAYDSSNLRRHVRTHSSERPYKCGQCDYSASRGYYIKTHILTHHA